MMTAVRSPPGTVTFLFTDVEGISSKATTTITTTVALPLATDDAAHLSIAVPSSAT